MKIVSVVGARPNFIKIAPFIDAIKDHNERNNDQIEHILVHTGQHYDENMSNSFFVSMGIPKADINLNIGSGSHAEQVGLSMMGIEKVIHEHHPDWVVVTGDVNAACAGAITAKKEGIKLAHIEAGLRSHDMSMPEEINRIITDRLSDLLFTPDKLSGINLLKEGLPEQNIRFVGNIMIDSLESHRRRAETLKIPDILINNLFNDESVFALPDLSTGFSLMTLHRPSNVDNREVLSSIVEFLTNEFTKQGILIWTIHPRTEKQLKSFGLWDIVVMSKNLIALKPLDYHSLLRLNLDALMMITDSGGLQEECCVLGTPCLTLRLNTERPITLKENGGASILVGNDIEKIRHSYARMMQRKRVPTRPELWDGKTAPRIVEALLKAANVY